MYNQQQVSQMLPNQQQMPTPQPRYISIILVPSIESANMYPINPGSSQFFLDEGMTTLVMKGRDSNGLPTRDRVFKIEEVTPKEQVNGSFVTKDEFNGFRDEVIGKMDQLLGIWQTNK